MSKSRRNPVLRSRRFVLQGAGAFGALAIGAPSLLAENAADERQTIVRRNYNRRPTAPTQTRVVTDGKTFPTLSPSSEQLLRDAVARYEIIVSRGGWPKVPASRRLVPGASGQAVTQLKQRLSAEGYLSYEAVRRDDVFDKELQSALITYQRAHGLRASGTVDELTRRELAISAADRLTALRANLPRIREYTKGLGPRYIAVNIPAAQMDVVENGRVYSRHNIIAGKKDRPTPILNSKVSELNFNPYWNAPVSIVRRDIIPEIQKKGLSVLRNLDIRIYDGYGGPEVDPSKVDFSNLKADRYHFRQEPGEGNAMASVKINFPNKYAVYMHDTPTKQLFVAGARYFSSGCVRVDQVHILTNWILNGQDGWNRDRIRDVTTAGERLDVKVTTPPQVRFAYLTAWVTADGRAHFRPDIYDLDGTGFITGQPEAGPESQAG